MAARQDQGGRTALHHAALRGDAVPDALLADAKVKDAQGSTAAHLAMREGHAAVALALARAAAWETGGDALGRTLAHWAAALGDEAALREVLDAVPGSASAATSSGSTPLHWAARDGNSACAALLLARGALPSVRNDGGDSPLDLALRRGDDRLARELERHMPGFSSAAAAAAQPPPARKKRPAAARKKRKKLAVNLYSASSP